MKLVHLVGFIIKKFVTIHGHMNVKKIYVSVVLVIQFKISHMFAAENIRET